jgi:hypothetical protein
LFASNDFDFTVLDLLVLFFRVMLSWHFYKCAVNKRPALRLFFSQNGKKGAKRFPIDIGGEAFPAVSASVPIPLSPN